MDQIDAASMTAAQFASLVATATEDEITTAIRGAGTGFVLERIFGNFPERFLADKASGVDAVIQFVVTDQAAEHPHVVAISGGTCTTEAGRAPSPKVTLTMELMPFVNLVGGREDGTNLFMRGKLKVSGDLMFAARIMTFFDRPKA